MEQWKDIVGYEDLYQVSNTGLVRSKHKFVNHKINGKQEWPERIINYNIQGNGYCGIRLSKDSIVKRYLVHRLVAIHFIDNPNSFPDVNHIDGNKKNNSASNLEWITKSNNTRHAIKNGLINFDSVKKPISLIKDGIVYNFDSINRAERELNIYNLSAVANGKYKQSCGYMLYKTI